MRMLLLLLSKPHLHEPSKQRIAPKRHDVSNQILSSQPDYTTTIVNLGNTSQEVSGGSPANDQYLAQLLSKPEAKVCDSVTIP